MLEEKTNKEILEELGRNFRQYRLTMGVTQKELASITNISVSTIHNFEAGQAFNISLNTIMTLMRHAGILDNVMKLIPAQPESPYARTKTKVRHAAKKPQQDDA